MFEHSVEVNKLFDALYDAQLEFPNVKKDAKNPHFSSRYVTLDQAKEELEPILRKHNLGVSQPAAGDGNGTGCTTILFLKGTGQWIAETLLLPSSGPGKESPTNAQTGTAAVTYSRRTAYLAILGVVADNDDDGNSAVRGSSKPAQKASPAKAQTVGKPATAEKGPEKASIPNGNSATVAAGKNVTASTGATTKATVESDAAEPAGDAREATKAEVDDFRKRYAKTVTILTENKLEASKGLPQTKKFLNFMLSITKAEKAEHQSFEAWTNFFKRIDAKLASPEGITQLVELVENANKK
jgi:hypothetical protein